MTVRLHHAVYATQVLLHPHHHRAVVPLTTQAVHVDDEKTLLTDSTPLFVFSR